jgi:hypothetical protein
VRRQGLERGRSGSRRAAQGRGNWRWEAVTSPATPACRICLLASTQLPAKVPRQRRQSHSRIPTKYARIPGAACCLLPPHDPPGFLTELAQLLCDFQLLLRGEGGTCVARYRRSCVSIAREACTPDGNTGAALAPGPLRRIERLGSRVPGMLQLGGCRGSGAPAERRQGAPASHGRRLVGPAASLTRALLAIPQGGVKNAHVVGVVYPVGDVVRPLSLLLCLQALSQGIEQAGATAGAAAPTDFGLGGAGGTGSGPRGSLVAPGVRPGSSKTH